MNDRTLRRLQVDPIACRGHGLCAELLPEILRLDEWGYPMITDPAVPRTARANARAAVAACPTLALRLRLLSHGEDGASRAQHSEQRKSLLRQNRFHRRRSRD